MRAVADELIVDPRDHWDDSEIRGAALNALIADPDVPAEAIDAVLHHPTRGRRLVRRIRRQRTRITQSV